MQDRAFTSLAGILLLAPACYSGIGGGGAGDPNLSGSGTDTAAESGGESADGGPADPPQEAQLIPETLARRMSIREIDRTLDDLLGDDAQAAAQFLPGVDYTPFDNDYETQDPSRTLIESMEVLAMDVADRLASDTARLDSLLPCTPTGADDSVCFRQFVEAFGRRALRRPLSDDEVDMYLALQDFSTESNEYVDNDFYTGVGLVVRTMLQDPEFLYRLEVGVPTSEDGVVKLGDYEIAARMAFLLTGSTPDDALLADAEAGRLGDPEGRLDAAKRLLQTPGAREAAYGYHALWLGYRAVPGTPELLTGWTMETQSLIDRVVFDERRPYRDLLTLDETYVDTDLAAHYGLPAPAGGQGWVSYEGTDRSGILGHGSVLAAYSKFSDTSPTQRGIFIRRRLMCADVPPPPPNVDVDNEPKDPTDPNACKETRYRAHMADGTCNACHVSFDPIGFGLENFDIEGRFRTTEDGRSDCTITGDGELAGLGTFSGPAELADMLSETELFEACAIEHYLAYAYGRQLTGSEQAHVEAFTELFADGGYDFAELMTQFVGHEVFGFKREPGA